MHFHNKQREYITISSWISKSSIISQIHNVLQQREYIIEKWRLYMRGPARTNAVGRGERR